MFRFFYKMETLIIRLQKPFTSYYRCNFYYTVLSSIFFESQLTNDDHNPRTKIDKGLILSRLFITFL